MLKLIFIFLFFAGFCFSQENKPLISAGFSYFTESNKQEAIYVKPHNGSSSTNNFSTSRVSQIEISNYEIFGTLFLNHFGVKAFFGFQQYDAIFEAINSSRSHSSNGLVSNTSIKTQEEKSFGSCEQFSFGIMASNSLFKNDKKFNVSFLYGIRFLAPNKRMQISNFSGSNTSRSYGVHPDYSDPNETVFAPYSSYDREDYTEPVLTVYKNSKTILLHISA